MYIALFYDQRNKLRQTPKAKSMKQLHQRVTLFDGSQTPSGGLVQVIKTHYDAVTPLGRYIVSANKLKKAH